MGVGEKVDHAWNVMKWMMSGENSVGYTLAVNHTISPVAAVSTLPAERLKEETGYDSVAHANQSAYSGPAGWGLLRYTTWGEWRAAIGPVYEEFNTGNMTAEEYGRAATDLLNAIIIPE